MPGIHVGKFRSRFAEEETPWDGIRWKDGNRWVIKRPREEAAVEM